MASIVRRGNHFIRLGDDWLLIDGPWYERLSSQTNEPYVLMYSLQPLLIGVADEPEPYPDTAEVRKVIWQRVRWLPSHSGNVWKNFVGVCLFDRWQRLLRNREKFGWKMLPDGALPAYLCRAELENDWGDSNYLIESGY